MPPLTSIELTWRPSDAVYQHLAQLSIPRDFVDDQVGNFVLYWHERAQQNQSWGSKFAKWVLREWREHEIKVAKQQQVKPHTVMTFEWRPSKKGVDHLLECGVPMHFINECIVSFVMYWQERGDMHNTWNTKFVEHVKYRDKQALALADAHNNGVRMRPIEEQMTDRSWADLPSVFKTGDKNA